MSVPITTGSGAPNETYMYSYLMNTVGLNKAAAVGVLTNIWRESKFKVDALGDNGTSYGICQWHNTRWTNLRNYCSRNNLNYTTIAGQAAFLYYELQQSYSAVINILRSTSNTADGCWDAAAQFCARFEIPSGYGSWSGGVLTLGSTSRARGDLAKSTWWPAYAGANTTSTPAVNKGSLVVTEARRHLGKPYKADAEGPNSFDCSGFVWYCYKTALGDTWTRMGAYSMYISMQNKVVWVKGSSDPWYAGDIVFIANKNSASASANPLGITHVGIATGDGRRVVEAQGVNTGVIESDWSNRDTLYAACRRISTAETSTTSSAGTTSPSSSSEDVFVSNTYAGDIQVSGLMYNAATDRYLNSMLEARESILAANSSGIAYGYLVDLTNGGNFRFIVPEYNESVRSNWESVPIIGRSIEIRGYNNTEARTINLTIELVAGEGLYKSGSDKIQMMENDIKFVKSLEYPDYSKALVFPPSVVYLYLNEYTQMRGIVNEVSVTYKRPFDRNNRPMMATLSFTVTQISDNPPDYTDIRNSNNNSY